MFNALFNVRVFGGLKRPGDFEVEKHSDSKLEKPTPRK